MPNHKWVFGPSQADTLPDPYDNATRPLYRKVDLEGVIRHEVGHALGLGGPTPFHAHEWNRLSLMHIMYSLGGSDVTHGDERNGIRFHYPDSPVPIGDWEHDVQLVGWKYRFGEWRAEPVSAPSGASYPYSREIPLGDSVDVEFTIENVGTRSWTQPESLGIFLSDDRSITPMDRLLKVVVELPLAPAIGGPAIDPTRTSSYDAVIPCDVIPNKDYYVGVIRDWNRSMPDRNPVNDVLLLPFDRNPYSIHVVGASSGPCAPQGGLPDPPRNFSASDNTCACILNWSPPLPGTGGGVTSYYIYRITPQGHLRIGMVDSTVTTYVDFPGGGPHSYYVRAGNSGGEGLPSNQDQGTQTSTPPPIPSDVTASEDRCDGIRVTWNYPFTPDSFIVRSFYWWNGNSTTTERRISGSMTSWFDSTVTGDNFRKGYTVRALAGCEGAQSPDRWGRRWTAGVPTPGSIRLDGTCPRIRVSWTSLRASRWRVQGYRIFRNGVQVYDGQGNGWGAEDPDRLYWDDTFESVTGPPRYYVQSYNPCITANSSDGVAQTQPLTFRVTANMPDAQILDNQMRFTVGASGYAVACTTCTASATRKLSVDGRQVIGGTGFCFGGWSNGRSRTHIVALVKDSTIALSLSTGTGPTIVQLGGTLLDDAFECNSPYIFQGPSYLATTSANDTFRVWGAVKFRMAKSPAYGLTVAAPFIARNARFESVDSTAISGSNVWQGLRLKQSASIFLDGCTIRNATAGVASAQAPAGLPQPAIATAQIERCTFTNNGMDLDLWFDPARSPSALITRSGFHDAKGLRIGLAGSSPIPVGTVSVDSNQFYAAISGTAQFELSGRWQGSITRNRFTVTNDNGLGLWLRRSGLSFEAPSVNITGNTFATPPTGTPVALKAPTRTLSVGNINAPNNDWRVYTAGQISYIIHDGSDPLLAAESLAVVTFAPWYTPPSGGGGGTGCPFVLTETDSGFSIENSILGRSELAGGSDVSDAYPLRNAKAGQSGAVRIRIAELESDTDVIDYLALGQVVVREGYELGTDMSGRAILFRRTASRLEETSRSGKVAPFISPGVPEGAYRGEAGDSLEFSTVESGTGASGKKRIGLNLIPKPMAATLREGGGVTVRVSGETDGDRWITLERFMPREYWSAETASLDALGGSPVRRIRVVWHSRHTLGWIGLIEGEEANVTMLPVIAATHSRGQPVDEELAGRDGVSTTLLPGEHVDLEFDGRRVAPEAQLVLLAHGRYSRQGRRIEEAPAVFTLGRNRPNPFNPVTEISFGLPTRSKVTIRIYDVGGRLVRTLIEDTLPAGIHNTSWDGRSDVGQHAASGVYFYEMRAGAFSERHRMVLLK
jgi:hypothetical protein